MSGGARLNMSSKGWGTRIWRGERGESGASASLVKLSQRETYSACISISASLHLSSPCSNLSCRD